MDISGDEHQAISADSENGVHNTFTHRKRSAVKHRAQLSPAHGMLSLNQLLLIAVVSVGT